MKELKFLYESSVKRTTEEKVTEKSKVDGEEVEISRNVKSIKPIKIAILKPSRKLYEGADVFYAKQIAEFIKAGLLPYPLVAKRYANDGGPLSEPEKNKIETLEKEASDLETKFYELAGEGEEISKEKNELLVKINNINTELSNIKNAYADIFENTAEMKARNKTIEWWVLHLSYINEDDKEYKSIFGDGMYENRLDKYDEYFEESNEFYNECIRKLSYLISFWIAAKSNLSKIDFESMDKLYEETLSSYKVTEGSK